MADADTEREQAIQRCQEWQEYATALKAEVAKKDLEIKEMQDVLLSQSKAASLQLHESQRETTERIQVLTADLERANSELSRVTKQLELDRAAAEALRRREVQEVTEKLLTQQHEEQDKYREQFKLEQKTLEEKHHRSMAVMEEYLSKRRDEYEQRLAALKDDHQAEKTSWEADRNSQCDLIAELRATQAREAESSEIARRQMAAAQERTVLAEMEKASSQALAAGYVRVPTLALIPDF
jgi:hypothetical protein